MTVIVELDDLLLMVLTFTNVKNLENLLACNLCTMKCCTLSCWAMRSPTWKPHSNITL